MKYFLSTLALLLLVSTSWASSQHSIEAHDPWVREAPPGATMLAAYLQLHNHGDKMRTLVSLESPAFEHIEVHRSMEKEGMMTMTKLSQVMIAAHGKVAFEPGGLHIMLIKPVAPLKAGNSVDITLRFKDGTSLIVNAEVRRDMMGGKSHHHGSHTPAAPLATPQTAPHKEHDHNH